MAKLIRRICLHLLVFSSFVFSSCNKKIDIGIVFPSEAEPRWHQDENAFRTYLGTPFSAEILFAEADVRSETDCVDELLKKGIKVLIIDPNKGENAVIAVEKAKEKGVIVISYDRLIRNTHAVDYFVTFDSFQVGVMQALFLDERVERGSKNNPLYIYTGALSDENSFMYFLGAWSILQPKIADGTYMLCNIQDSDEIKNKKNFSRQELEHYMSQITTKWTHEGAREIAEKNLAEATDEQKKGCFIIAPNDGTARAIADAFAKVIPTDSFIITGQDAELESMQYILDGKQDMTIWKNTNILAKDAVNLATDILENRRTVTTTLYNNGLQDIPTKQTAVTVIDRGNIQMLIDSNYNGIKDKRK